MSANKYPFARPFDFVRVVQGMQDAIATLQVKASPTQVVSYPADTTQLTCTLATNTPVTKDWPIVANDAKVGTRYQLTSWGFGTWGSTAQNLNPYVAIDDTPVNTGTHGQVAAAAFAANTVVNWTNVIEILVTVAGNPGAFQYNQSFTISRNTAVIPSLALVANIGPTTADTAIDWTVAHTLGMGAFWTATVGAPTITCTGSALVRMGP
jgi:hypothetical protein